jgi:hypothetical protein
VLKKLLSQQKARLKKVKLFIYRLIVQKTVSADEIFQGEKRLKAILLK